MEDQIKAIEKFNSLFHANNRPTYLVQYKKGRLFQFDHFIFLYKNDPHSSPSIDYPRRTEIEVLSRISERDIDINIDVAVLCPQITTLELIRRIQQSNCIDNTLRGKLILKGLLLDN